MIEYKDGIPYWVNTVQTEELPLKEWFAGCEFSTKEIKAEVKQSKIEINKGEQL